MIGQDTLGSALRLYGPQRTVVSFNGGKDADVSRRLTVNYTLKHMIIH